MKNAKAKQAREAENLRRMATTADTKRILIAEDSPTQAEKLKFILERHGYEVAVAGSGVQALAFLAESKPCLLISDIVMPEMNGFELCRRIRADKNTFALPVVLLTALTDTQDVLEGLSCGADAFITKPYSEDYLLVQVARLLADRQRSDGTDATVNLDIMWAGKTCTIVTDQKRTFSLLISIYEAAVRRNMELSKTQDELRALNDRLEDKVEERTAELSSEIAARKREAEQLASLKRHYELILCSTAEGILGLDLQGNHTFGNPAANRMLGYEAEELFGCPSHSVWHHTKPDGSPYPKEECQINAAFQDGAVHQSSDEFFWRKDGASFPVEYTSTPIWEQGRLVGAVATFVDITDRLRSVEEKAKLEDQLRQAQKMEAIGRLAGGVAHDFNNMTAIVLGYGEMLLGRLGLEDPARKWAEQIVAAGQRSSALTRQLLAFSRKQTLQPVVLDLNALLRNLENMLGRLIGEDINLEFRLAADLGRVSADPGQLEQIVMNLVLNARDAMSRGGRLTVETADVELDKTYALGHESVIPGRYVMLAMTDTGCGMDKATLARIYEPFFTTKDKGKGTGLGLATAYGIVKQSGGHIWVYSEPGKGTAFKIYLPRTDAEPVAKAVEAGGETPRGQGERILLVEDEAPLREMCETVLSSLGYRVEAAGSGPEALLLVEKKGFETDLVVTDVVMPGMSGTEMADRLRENRPGLRVLYMSGYPDDTIFRHGVLDPGTSFLQKPFLERALAVKVREALGENVVGSEVLEGAAADRPGRRVLMIDDDEQYRELVQHFCAKRGHVFAGVGDSASAIAALAGQPFDVLLVDKNIPGTSGEHVLQEIRAAGHATPAIVLTGDVASADMEVLRPLGVVRALEKSSNAAPLLQAIEAVGAAGDSLREVGADTIGIGPSRAEKPI